MAIWFWSTSNLLSVIVFKYSQHVTCGLHVPAAAATAVTDTVPTVAATTAANGAPQKKKKTKSLASSNVAIAATAVTDTVIPTVAATTTTADDPANGARQQKKKAAAVTSTHKAARKIKFWEFALLVHPWLANGKQRGLVPSWFISIITMVFSFVSDYVES
jgi:hypothetical protein